MSIAIKSLNRGKSYGLDNLIDEMFIDGIHALSPLLVNIFNYIFESGTYPQEWLKGIIASIPKKGYLTDANNYRGITIMSVFAKLFSIILNNRLVKFAENSSQFNDFQYGFREKRSTTDCLFILHNMIKCTLDILYCTFVDFKAAIDLVTREELSYKLQCFGVSNKIVDIIKSMYTCVKLCIRQFSSLSDFFNSNVGVKQGEPLSPFLFLLYINDLADELRCGNYENL